MTTPGAADLERILDYLDGRLSERDRIVHELRLAEEDELRAAHESFERLDLLQRLALRRRRAGLDPPADDALPAPRAVRDASGPRLRPRWGAALIAAALALVLAIGLRSLLEVGGAAEFDVAAVPTATTLFDHNLELGLAASDARKVPAGHATRGGDLTIVSDEEYLALVADLDRARMEAALAGPAAPPHAGHFVLPIRPRRASWAVVLLFTDDGRPVGARGEPGRIAFPAESDAGGDAGFVAGGRVRVLPTESVVRVTDDSGPRVDYRPGFLVPLRARRVHALVGLRSEPLDAALRAEIEAELRSSVASSAEEALARWRRRLETLGFRTRTLEILEP